MVHQLVRKTKNAQKIGSGKIRKNKNDDENEKNGDENGELEKGSNSNSKNVNVKSGVMKNIEAVNPVGLGRKSRQIFDEVWKKFSGLGQISRTEYDVGTSNNLLVYGDGAPLCEFTIPGAQNTTVVVVGATSRIGCLVVRKLMLRGYTVKGVRTCLRAPRLIPGILKLAAGKTSSGPEGTRLLHYLSLCESGIGEKN